MFETISDLSTITGGVTQRPDGGTCTDPPSRPGRPFGLPGLPGPRNPLGPFLGSPLFPSDFPNAHVGR